MKALTIKQPWAMLIFYAGKDVENRDWATSYRGTLAIHTSKNIERKELQFAADFLAYRNVTPWNRPPYSIRPSMLPNINRLDEFWAPGCVVGTVELVDCVGDSESPWFVGDYGLVLRNPKLLEKPIPAKGQLGLWNWNPPA